MCTTSVEAILRIVEVDAEEVIRQGTAEDCCTIRDGGVVGAEGEGEDGGREVLGEDVAGCSGDLVVVDVQNLKARHRVAREDLRPALGFVNDDGEAEFDEVPENESAA